MNLFLDEYLYKATYILVKYYKREETVPLEYDWPTCCVEHYTPLTMFCYKNNYTKSGATAVARMLTSAGAMAHEHHAYGKITENIRELFAPFDKFACSPYIILIEGAAGIGKSTFCKEIALQWANKNVLKNRSHLFLLSMHDSKIKSLKNVELLVKYFIKSENLAGKIVEWLKETDGKYLTIIIDGYSEDSRSSFITDDIIGRKILTQCGLIITSRSGASSHLSEIISQKALILGFNKSNQITFIDTALKDSHSKIKHYLHSNLMIDSLCNIPLIMTMMLWFVVNDEETDNLSQASLIQNYIMMITKKKIIPCSLINIDLHHTYDQVIKDLSQFAFIAIQEDQYVFTMSEILKLCEKHFQVYWEGPDFLGRMLKLGLLSTLSFQEENVDCNFFFSNVKIQEYLAAYYIIASLPDNELLKLLYGTFLNIHYLNVWILYVDISEGKNSIFKYFLYGETSDVSVKTIEVDGDFDNRLLDIDLKQQKLSHDHIRALAMLLSKLPKKQWRNLNLASCDIDSHGCTILCEICSNTTIKFDTIDISYNNLYWESFNTIRSMLKAWHTEKYVFSVDMLYDTATINDINSFIATLEENFQNDESSDNVLLLTYVAKQSKLTAVYSAPTCIRWFYWNGCKLNEDTIKHIKTFIEKPGENNRFKLVFSYCIIDNVENLPTLLSDIKCIQLRGSFLYSKGAYLLNIASKIIIDYQYNSPQELIADYLAAFLSHNTQSTTPYLESLPATYATIIKNSLQPVSVFDISNNSNIDSHVATEIGIVLSHTRNLQIFNASGNNLPAESLILIATGLQNISTLEVFNINDNDAGEEAADAIATVLAHNSQLQRLHLSNNKLKTSGMIKIANALQNILTLTVLNISKNSISEEAADYLASVLSHNTQLERLHLSDNNFETIGMIKIAKALQNILTLKVFNINYNNVSKEAADDIAIVLRNTELQKLHLSNNNFKTLGVIKIAKALQNNFTLMVINLNNNSVGEEAAEDIAKALSCNTCLQELYLDNNSFNTAGMIKIAKALQNILTLTVLSISNNNVNEEAADYIATVLSRNTQLRMLDIHSNNFRTTGTIKITKALKNTPTLVKYDISNNGIKEEAVKSTLRNILSWNSKLNMHA